ncbi:cobalamin-5'-phosphate synthase [Sporobacter termitidis DSM 10068]|uniref:Adenosylcobinamide-GDP ribazoletransferase n=1 Tax=Sporobacter termitidis DSM 10068 TaxID=1123282 RepID=A0A1M5X3D4_9FIRM|nr:adenosylcobinamide-GDP ribazoletransferase [Sporobacter termitidis]SHH94347.1 cobalamin-5'-phosphate synthase [Sporobacter termitidis DSM 10068]
MNLVRSFVTAFSMFSKLPVPTLKWRDDNMRYMLAMFPFVGAVVGLFVWAWLWISEALGFGALLRAAGLTLLPVAVTGGIHLDGFCDTSDALASHAPAERKREILKDPHTGAFAVISVVAYLILYFALSTELQVSARTPLLLGAMFVLSRTLSGLSVLLFAPNGGKGLLSTFKNAAEKQVSVAILAVFFLLCLAGLLLTDLYLGAAMIAAAVLCVLYLFFMARRQFGGMSGDLAGYFLQLGELCMLAAMILIQKVVFQ